MFSGGKRVTLDINFRSNDQILEAANRVLEDLGSATTMVGVLGESDDAVAFTKYEDEFEEAKHIVAKIAERETFSSEAVLYRVNGQSGLLQSELGSAKIPFTVSGSAHSFFDMPEIKPLVAYLKLSQDSQDVDSLKAVWNKPNRYIKTDWLLSRAGESESQSCVDLIAAVMGQKMGPNQRSNLNSLRDLLIKLAKHKGTPSEILDLILASTNYRGHLMTYAKDSNKDVEDLYRAVEQFRTIVRSRTSVRALIDHIAYTKKLQKESQDKKKGVSLSTIHSSKGLEYPRVFLIGAEEGTLPHEKMFSEAEEQRLVYVALTRAEHELEISYYEHPSRFLRNQIPEVPSSQGH